MDIKLIKANLCDCEKIQEMQKISFASLLQIYQDYNTSSATESLETIIRKFNEPQTTYYFISAYSEIVGVVRVFLIDKHTARISPISILPQHQNKGFAQYAMFEIERTYPDVTIWKLDTIKQEKKLKYFYEKLGYIATGKEEDIKQDMTIVYYQKTINPHPPSPNSTL